MSFGADIIDAKPLWAALYHSANPIKREDYEHRRLSMYQVSSRCDGLTIRSKRLILGYLVAREGVEPPTPAFSELTHPVFPTTSMVAVGLPNTGKYAQDRRIVGDCRG